MIIQHIENGLIYSSPIATKAEPDIPHKEQRTQWESLVPTDAPGIRVDEGTGIRWSWDARAAGSDFWMRCGNSTGEPKWKPSNEYHIYPLESQQEANARIVRECPEGSAVEWQNASPVQPSLWREIDDEIRGWVQNGEANHLRFRIIPASGSAEAKEEPGEVKARFETYELTEYSLPSGHADHAWPIRKDRQGRWCIFPCSGPIALVKSEQVKRVWEQHGRKPVVEVFDPVTSRWNRMVIGKVEPMWSDDFTYRLQPLAKSEPWTKPEQALGKMVRNKSTKSISLITSAHALTGTGKLQAYVSCCGWRYADELHDDFEQLDGSACGTEGGASK